MLAMVRFVGVLALGFALPEGVGLTSELGGVLGDPPAPQSPYLLGVLFLAIAALAHFEPRLRCGSRRG